MRLSIDTEPAMVLRAKRGAPCWAMTGEKVSKYLTYKVSYRKNAVGLREKLPNQKSKKTFSCSSFTKYYSWSRFIEYYSWSIYLSLLLHIRQWPEDTGL